MSNKYKVTHIDATALLEPESEAVVTSNILEVAFHTESTVFVSFNQLEVLTDAFCFRNMSRIVQTFPDLASPGYEVSGVSPQTGLERLYCNSFGEYYKGGDHVDIDLWTDRNSIPCYVEQFLLQDASQTDPVVITIDSQENPCLSNGQQVVFDGVGGMTELNNNIYYVKPIVGTSPPQSELYLDPNLTNSVDGTGFSAYSSGGQLTPKRPCISYWDWLFAYNP